MPKNFRTSAPRSSEGQSPVARITAEIISRLEAGTKPWVQPWRGAPISRPLRACGTPYRGMNVFWLWMVADMFGYPRGAQVVFRILDNGEPNEDDQDDAEWAYECLCEQIRASASAAFPSFRSVDGWRGREDRVLLHNAYADIGISTYGSIAAIWIAERDDPAYYDADARCCRSGRGRQWLTQVAPRFDALFAQLDCLGRMSNGESVFRRRKAAWQGNRVNDLS